MASLDKSWRYSMGRLKRLKIGGIFTGIGTIMIFLGFLIFQQKQRLENIKNTVAYQENELNKQKELYGTLNETYHHLKDSIKFEAGKARLHEEKKDKVITTFRRELKAISAKSLDSIKRTREARENFIIRQNYVNRANKLYNEMPKEIDGEDLGPILFPIMNNTITETFNEFNKYPVDIGMSDEE